MQLFKECITNGPRPEQQQANPELYQKCIALNLPKGLSERRLQLLGRKLFRQCALNQPVDSNDLQGRVDLLNKRLKANDKDEWKITVDDFVELCELNEGPKHINQYYYNLLNADDKTLAKVDALEQSGRLPASIVDQTMSFLQQNKKNSDVPKRMTVDAFFDNVNNPDIFISANDYLFFLKSLQDNVETLGAFLVHDPERQKALVNKMVTSYINRAVGPRGFELAEVNPKVFSAIEKLYNSLSQQVEKYIGKDLSAQELSNLDRKVTLILLKNLYASSTLTQEQKDMIVNYLSKHIDLLAHAIADNKFIMKSPSFQAVEYVKGMIQDNMFIDASFIFEYKDFLKALDEAVEEKKQSYIQSSNPIARQGFMINQLIMNPNNTMEYTEFIDTLTPTEKYNYDMYLETMMLSIDDDKLMKLDEDLVDMFLDSYNARVDATLKQA